MGNLFRLAVFILVLGSLAAGTAAMLLHERQREHVVERMINRPGAQKSEFDRSDTLIVLRDRHARTQRAILLFGGLALACVIAVAIVPTRTAALPVSTDPDQSRTEMRGMETLARATIAQNVELTHEREARHRSEQDLNLQQLLANRALQDKVRLGRDLHDGLVQTLYATGLVLETAAQQLAGKPPLLAEAARLIERAKTTLNAAIREARGTIGSLTPDALDNQNFAASVAALLDHLDCGRLRQRNVHLHPAIPVFPEPTRTELLQIIRESVSNALRHGAASRLDLSFTPLPDGRLQLTLQDDGRGFDPAAITRGHGLDNLAARARTLGGTLVIDAAPGRGTTVTLTLPAPVV